MNRGYSSAQLLSLAAATMFMVAPGSLVAQSDQLQECDMDHSMMRMDHRGENDSSGEMQMDGMQMQGGDAPADARDPHAYSNGYTLTEGPYALPGVSRLRLADEHKFWAFMGDRIEYDTENDTGIFDVQGWYGTTYDRFVVKSEGELADSRLEESQTDLLWGHAVTGYFDRQLGIRLDQYDEGENREWLAFGFRGLAPYWFELDMTAYLGKSGRTAFALEAEYDFLFSQRLILQPRAEITAYGKDDRENGLGSGLSDVSLGLRLRYEFTRQFAPYIGVEWTGKFGATADFAEAENNPARDTVYVLGVRVWF